VRPVGLGILALTSVGALGAACGKKGPPQAPLRIAPAAITDLSARRIGDDVVLRFTLPAKSDDGTTPADVARVDVYAVSVGRASDGPAPQAFVREAQLIGRVEVMPEQATVTFVESLAGQPMPPPPEEAKPAVPPPPITDAVAAAPGAEAATAEPAPAVPIPVRLYGVVPVSARGRRGALSPTVPAPLESPPPAPAAPMPRYTETKLIVEWLEDEAATAYNVYDDDAGAAEGAAPRLPLNQKPLPEPPYEDARLEFGIERCYRVSAVVTVGAMPVESAPSAPACVTPVDTFAPPAPAGLAAVAGPGSISLIWDAVEAPDLAGYVVLRGDAAGDTLQALTPEPIRETTYRDDAVAPGLRYVYTVIAVDDAGNSSAQSARAEETAR
jgi:hypothetical protein